MHRPDRPRPPRNGGRYVDLARWWPMHASEGLAGAAIVALPSCPAAGREACGWWTWDAASGVLPLGARARGRACAGPGRVPEDAGRAKAETIDPAIVLPTGGPRAPDASSSAFDLAYSSLRCTICLTSTLCSRRSTAPCAGRRFVSLDRASDLHCLAAPGPGRPLRKGAVWRVDSYQARGRAQDELALAERGREVSPHPREYLESADQNRVAIVR